MQVACVGDLHLISDRDPHRALYAERAFFTAGYPSLHRLIDRLNQRRPDLVVFLGDLVDWVSDENIAFALDVLARLRVPWRAVPGNHDLAAPLGGHDTRQTIMDRAHKRLWRKHGIELDDRWIDGGAFGLVLLDNSLSHLEPASLPWLDRELGRRRFNLVCQHVPLDIPENRAHLAATAPGRHLGKYTCSGDPGLYGSHYRGRVQAVCHGHVHLAGTTRSDDCVHHLCPLALTMTDPNRGESTVAAATLMTFAAGAFSAETLMAD
jgi:3',5'-cyclic AMP phosphodiesterase CpdA